MTKERQCNTNKQLHVRHWQPGTGLLLLLVWARRGNDPAGTPHRRARARAAQKTDRPGASGVRAQHHAVALQLHFKVLQKILAQQCAFHALAAVAHAHAQAGHHK